MVISKEQVEEFKEASKPLVKFLNENCHPHVYAIVSPSTAELVESVSMVKIEEFIKD